MHRMFRLGMIFGAMLSVSLAAVGVSLLNAQNAKQETKGATLVVRLPESLPAPSHAPERITYLKINDKDYTEPKSTRRTIKLDSVSDKPVKVVYSFWPNTYTNIVRTREVTLKSGDIAKLDFTTEDPKAPRDKIIPIYYPTPPAVVAKMCELAKVTKEDVVWDIGCGDGRMVMMAVEKFQAKKGVGIDFRPELVKKCQAEAVKRGLDRCFFRQGDALKADDMKELPEANVVLLYLGEHLNMKLRPVLQKNLKKGSRVVSHLFDMGDWKPDRTQTFTAKNNYDEDQEYSLHLWIIK